MNSYLKALRNVSVSVVLSAGFIMPAAADTIIDLGTSLPAAETIKQGLFPEDADCMALIAHGYKCMNFKPPARYSIPATSFQIGSAELPDGLKPQLNVFAEVLSSQRGDPRKVIIRGHADASGSEDINNVLSAQRAEEVRKYLVARGADPRMLETEGMGSKQPLDQSNPLSAKNRRVEIGRVLSN